MTKSVLFCLPFYSSIQPRCLTSIDALKELKDYKIEVAYSKSGNIVNARNKQLRDSPAHNLYYTLDSDIEFSPKQFVKLADAAEKYQRVVSGWYKNKVDGQIEAGYFSEGASRRITAKELPVNDFYKEVDWSGNGFRAFTRETLERMTYPYFAQPVNIEPDGIVDTIGEDVYFTTHDNEKVILVGGCEVVHLQRADEALGIAELPIAIHDLPKLEKALKYLPMNEVEGLVASIRAYLPYIKAMEQIKKGLIGQK